MRKNNLTYAFARFAAWESSWKNSSKINLRGRFALRSLPAALAIALPIALLAALLLPSAGSRAGSGGKSYIVYFGTYTRISSEGIYGYRFLPATGDLTPLGLIQQANNPSWLTDSPNQRFLYSTNEHKGKTEPGNTITAYAMNTKTGKLKFLNTVSAKGVGPAHLAIDKTGRMLVSANFGNGSIATFPIHPDGWLGEAAGYVEHHGSAPGPRVPPDENGLSPSDPHNHCVMFSPDNRFLLACNIGLGKVFVYKINRETGALEQNGEPFTTDAPAWRPRHLAFSPNGKYVYIISGSMQLTTATYDAAHGTLKELQTLPFAHEGVKSEGSEVRVDRLGRFVYASSRGTDAHYRSAHGEGSIDVFAVDAAAGTLSVVQHISSGGETPRTFTIDPTGAYMFVGNENSNTIVIFSVDPQTGKLAPTGKVLKDVPEPSCILFVAER
jgi:6-phosphogluconolactonase